MGVVFTDTATGEVVMSLHEPILQQWVQNLDLDDRREFCAALADPAKLLEVIPRLRLKYLGEDDAKK